MELSLERPETRPILAAHLSPGGRVAATRSPAAITLSWLARLRWGAVLGQTATVLVARFVLNLALPMGPLVALLAAAAASNLALVFWLRRTSEASTRILGLVLGADILLLAGLLYESGGPSNPFSIFYLVHITLAALVLGMRWAAAIVALSAASYASLFFWHVPIPGMEHMHHGGGSAYSIHLQGMWVAFLLSASLIAYFVSRVAAALRQRDAELAVAEGVVARAEKLASLTTLSAGAAHELGSPLATIAVVAKELERSIFRRPEEAQDDARLIRTEVERCRTIIQRMAAQAGGTIGELPEHTTDATLWRRCLERLAPVEAKRVACANDPPIALTCHVEGLVQVLVCLVQNALDASRDTNGMVDVRSELVGRSVRFVVTDEGSGVPPDILGRLGEPFFTTKPPGEGMGLGLFLANTFAERSGGKISFSSPPKGGTSVALELPQDPGGVHG